MYVNTFILKGVGGLAACASVAVPGVIFREPIGKYLKNKFFPESQEALMEKVGLGCGIPSAQGTDCSKRGTNNIKAKKGDNNTIEVSGISNGKIKLYKAQESEGYFKNLKFVIEEGDIDSTTTDKKLEQFETYEIKNEGENYFLSRKTETKNEIEGALGLPSDCNLPTSDSASTCDDLELEKMKLLAFEERGGDSPTLSGKVKLTITKLTSNDSLFPFGYKFSFQGKETDATLSWTTGNKTISFKNAQDTEYRIKKNDGNLISLEEAWNQNTLTDRVGLSCTGGVPTTANSINCVKKNGDGVKIKAKKDSTTFDLDNISQGKIKLYKAEDSEGYFKNLKFVIEGGDISGTNSNKLEQFETYEIKKDETSGTHYLTKKKDAKDGIKKALGIPNDCNFPTTTGQEGCDISGDKFKKVKFDGISTTDASASGNPKLKISTADASEFPLGYKFVLESTNDAKISDSLTIKDNTNTEFKIKKNTENNDITLERAWSVTTLGQKIKLTCTTDPKQCSYGASINVYESNSNKVTDSTFQNGDSSKKITYEDGQPGYNQGFKFYTSEDINLQNSSGVSKIEKKEGDTGTSYEIKQDNGTWYLFKKAGAART